MMSDAEPTRDSLSVKHIDLEAYSPDLTINEVRRKRNEEVAEATQKLLDEVRGILPLLNRAPPPSSIAPQSKPWATHIFIDAPGCDEETVQVIQAKAERWLREGGVLCIGGGQPDRPLVTLSFGRLEEGAFFSNQLLSRE